jgi:hypothetical protein
VSADANGYFDDFVNRRAAKVGPAERALMGRVTGVVQAVIPGAGVHWAGSQRKGTGVIGSDLDMCIASNSPVDVATRKKLRAALADALGRDARIQPHVVRVIAGEGIPKLDLAFANAAFGSRPLPNLDPFHNQGGRQTAARAMKLWTRGGNLPRVSGWALEAIVVHLDQPGGRAGLDLFRRVVAWIEITAKPADIESVLRASNSGQWPLAWSSGLPGRLEALRNAARALRMRSPAPEAWRSSDDVGRWLCP